MPRISNTIMALCLTVILFTACSTKKVASYHAVESLTAVELASLSSLSDARHYLSGNVKLSAVVNGEKSTLRGKLRVDSDKGVQLGVVAMNMVEVACLEFYPEEVRIIHKMDKLYSDIPYSGFTLFNQLWLDYSSLVATLLNRFHVIDKTSLLSGGVLIKDSADCVELMYGGNGNILYRFFVEKATGNLVLAERVYPDGTKAVCRYSGFEPVGNRYFPHTIELRFEGIDTPASLKLTLTGLSDERFDFSPRKIKDTYERIETDNLDRLFGEF